MIEALTAELIRSGALSQMGGQIGAEEPVLNDAIAAALPMLITALARNTSSSDGAESLSGALERDHDGSILDDLGGFMSQGGNPSDGEAILGHMFGDRQETVERGLSTGSGVDFGVIQQLLPLLAPIVLGYLGRQQRQNQYGPDDLSGFLRNENEEMIRRAPPESNLGGLASILDMDHDGDIADDAAKLGAGLLDSFLKGRG
jgi:hypothetical protein